MRVMFLSGVSMVRPMMSHDVRFYMKYSTIFSPVNTIIQTRIVLRVLPDNQKNFTQSREIENLNFNPLFPTLKLDLCKNYSFANAQTVARVFIYNSKQIIMVSLSNQILTLESLIISVIKLILYYVDVTSFDSWVLPKNSF